LLETALRSVVLAVGSTVILYGAMLLFLPGGGWFVITADLSMLATQFVWARTLLTRVATCRKG
jgi:Tfp pilus assembly protein PilZ